MAGSTPAVRERLLGALAAGFIRLLRRVVRIRYHDDATIRSWEATRRRFVLAFWHRHLLLMRYAYRGDRMTVMSSRSRDGEIMVQALRRLGISTVRGSTTRGAVAGLREIVRAARAGSDLGFTPDGPRGPARKVQPGVLFAAAMAGIPILPVSLAATRQRALPTWDELVLPLPGARVEVVYGDPIEIPDAHDAANWAPRLESALDALELRAEDLAGRGAGE